MAQALGHIQDIRGSLDSVRFMNGGKFPIPKTKSSSAYP
jgi:hypothetical protein